MIHKKYNDKELTEMIREGDRKANKAFRYIYDKSGITDKITGVLFKMGAERYIANDIMQDSLAALYLDIKNNKFREESSISSYSVSIAKFKYLNWLRDNKNGNELSNIDNVNENDIISMHDGYSKEEEQKIVQKFLNASSEKCRKLLMLYLDGFNYKEISRLVQKEHQTIKNNISNCYKELRGLIDEDPDFVHV